MNPVRIVHSIIAAGIMLSISGCVSTQQEKEQAARVPFPEPAAYDMVFSRPVETYTRDKADAILQNLQPYIYQLRGETTLAKADDVVVDGEAIKIKWVWEELETENVSQKSTTSEDRDVTGDILKGILSGKKQDLIGALLSGATESPTQSHTSTMQVTRKVPKHGKTIVMFEDVSTIARSLTNYIILRLKSGEDVYIICNNEYYRQKWIDAFFSAMRTRGYHPEFRLGVLCQKEPMNGEQTAYLQVDGGAVVLGVMKGSPAETIGIEYLDVITKVNDVKISSGEELTAYLKNKKPRNNERMLFKIVKSRRENGQVSTVTVRKELIVKL